MDSSVYNPEKLVYNYRKLGHGKAKIEAMRYAINQADLNNDIPYMIFFRKELSEESSWYIDELDVITVYPELLALTDKYPDAALTRFDGYEDDVVLPVLWEYESLLCVCSDFYQVPMEDCIRFHNDFKERWVAYGNSATEPCRMITEFYIGIGNMEKAAEAFKEFKQCQQSRKEPYDCAGCAANTEIKYYLDNNEKEKADILAQDIENYKLMCSSSESDSLLRLKGHYLEYYILHGNYEKAAEAAHILEHSGSQTKEFKPWASFMCGYVHSRPSHSLRIYKKHWKDCHEEHNPGDRYDNFKNIACFFKGLEKEKSTDTVKLMLDSSFPLYNKDNIYNTRSMAEYYYKEAEEIAKKFDKRNGTDKYIKELEMSFANAW